MVVVFGRFSKLSSSSSFELFEFCCCRQGFKDFGILLTLRQISLGHQHALLATPAKVEPTVGWGRRSHAAADAVALYSFSNRFLGVASKALSLALRTTVKLGGYPQ